MSLDKILKSDEKPYISPVINIRQFLADASAHNQMDRLRQCFDDIPSASAAADCSSVEQSAFSNASDPRKNFLKFVMDRGFSTEDAAKAIASGDLIFSDLRLLLPGDEQNLAEYPIRQYDSVHQKMCVVCTDLAASFVVTESDRLPMTPAFFCRKCFRAFHYDGEQRIGQFKAFHFMDHAGRDGMNEFLCFYLFSLSAKRRVHIPITYFWLGQIPIKKNEIKFILLLIRSFNTHEKQVFNFV